MSGWRVWRAFEKAPQRDVDGAFIRAILAQLRTAGPVDVDELERLLDFFNDYPRVDA